MNNVDEENRQKSKARLKTQQQFNLQVCGNTKVARIFQQIKVDATLKWLVRQAGKLRQVNFKDQSC